ncbi:MAG: type II toxin-antitoxin system Phd/YefM family antitoxin [Gemmatimonadaceae bacterium]
MAPKKKTTIPAAEFKAKCLKVMETVRATGEEVVITKHGKPVARLVPVTYVSRPFFGRNAGMTVFEGDMITPIDVEWEAERG